MTTPGTTISFRDCRTRDDVRRRFLAFLDANEQDVIRETAAAGVFAADWTSEDVAAHVGNMHALCAEQRVECLAILEQFLAEAGLPE